MTLTGSYRCSMAECNTRGVETRSSAISELVRCETLRLYTHSHTKFNYFLAVGCTDAEFMFKFVSELHETVIQILYNVRHS
jgi:hypothetical protein